MRDNQIVNDHWKLSSKANAPEDESWSDYIERIEKAEKLDKIRKVERQKKRDKARAKRKRTGR